MKNLLILTILTTFASITKADVTSRILHISAPENMSDSYEVLTSDRNVLHIDANNNELIDSLFEAKEKDSLVNLRINNTDINSIEVLAENEDEEIVDQDLHPMINYTPSIISNIDQATQMFKSLNANTKWFSQCFNRAHIWSKQLYDSYSIKSMKILIYYTKKYRREIDGKWWFHIAPMVNVAGQRMVLDREFTSRPYTDENWEKIFISKMKSKGVEGYRCKVIENISEYYDETNQNNEYCNIQVTSMYYWEPSDMSRLDKKGIQKTEFINWQLRAASKEAFKKWRQVYDSVKVK